MGGVVAAALHAQDETPLYPLGGLIASGMGDKQSLFMKSTAPSYITVDTDHGMFPLDAKDAIMFKPGTVSSEVLEHSERLNAMSPLSETTQFPAVWLPTWKERWAVYVSTPRIFSLVEDDPFFVCTEKEIETFGRRSRTVFV
ncbi:hypothetical protein ACMFMG_010338 [Clarireedia jacksonii]